MLRKSRNIEIYKVTSIAVPPSDSYDKVIFTIRKDAIYQAGASKGYIRLPALLQAVSQYEDEKTRKNRLSS